MNATSSNDTVACRRIRVFHVDDHPPVIEALAYAISREADMEVCGSAADAREALRAIAERAPDVVVADISMPGVSGIELIRQLCLACPRAPVVVFSMLDETVYAEVALRAGAKGYVTKTQRTAALIEAIRKVLAGHLAVSDAMTTRLLAKAVGNRDGGTPAADSVASKLTQRELEVFRLIGQGFTIRQIALELKNSPKTVESHCAAIKRKLGLPNAVALQQDAAVWVKTLGC